MEFTKLERIDLLELHKYTKEQLFIKDKIQLGIVLDNYDYLEIYYDLLDNFKTLVYDYDEIRSEYINYLNNKYDCNFNSIIIKNIIIKNN